MSGRIPLSMFAKESLMRAALLESRFIEPAVEMALIRKSSASGKTTCAMGPMVEIAGPREGVNFTVSDDDGGTYTVLRAEARRNAKAVRK